MRRLLSCGALLWGACTGGGPDAVPTVVTITDVALDAGLQDFEVGGHFKRGRGCTIADLDRDGRPDVVVTNPGDESLWYRNLSDPGRLEFRVAGVLDRDGLAWGAVAADYDGDGDLDLFLPYGGLEGRAFDRLLRNDLAAGEVVFTDVTDEAGVSGPYSALAEAQVATGSSSAAWVDFDGDGLLDLHVDAAVVPLMAPGQIPADSVLGRNTLWRNLGDGTFEDVTAVAGLTRKLRSRVSTWLDYDGDGDPDLYENNFRGPNALYRNDGGVFVDVSQSAALDGGDLRYPAESFSSATADFNSDGWPDLIVFVRGWPAEGPYLEGHVLQLNVEGRGFVEASGPAGLNMPFEAGLEHRDHLSLGVMGSTARDVDLDGLPDVFIGNGGPTGGTENQLFLATGLEWHDFGDAGRLRVPRFENRSADIQTPAPVAPSGPAQVPPYPYRTHGACVADLDGDGAAELFVVNGGMTWLGGDAVREPNRVFRVDVEPRPETLELELVGDGVAVPVQPIGARIDVGVQGADGTVRVVRDTLWSRNGFSAQHGYVRLLGLGRARKVLWTRITWPDGVVQDVPGLEVGSSTVVHHP